MAIINRELTKKELATVLAALRYWQQELEKGCEFCGGTGEFKDHMTGKTEACDTCNGQGWNVPISEHFEDDEPLTSEQIDELCERLNCG